MELYDISQESLACRGFKGMVPARMDTLEKISKGDSCNYSVLSQSAHNGTHCDAPCHFIEGGKSIDELPLERFVGKCILIERSGEITASDAEHDSGLGYERILYKGDVTVTREAAMVFAGSEVRLIGNESPTVGPEDAPQEVHRILLGAGIILLEGIRPEKAPAGEYILSAAPVVYRGCDGGPCRAYLMKL